MPGFPKNVLLIGSALLIGGAGLLATQMDTAAAPRQDDPKEEPKSDREKAQLARFMRQKLTASENVLEGLVIEDFKLIRRGAARLKKMSAAEEWRVSNNAMYRQYSSEFRRKVERLENMAKEKKLEGAALTYLEVTMSCLECHKYVRAQLIAGDHRAGDRLSTERFVQSARQLEGRLSASPESTRPGPDEGGDGAPFRR